MILDLHNKLKAGSISTKELAEEYLKIAEDKNKVLNSYISITREYALSHLPDKIESILDGIPSCIKDNINILSTNTTAGSQVLKEYISPYTATVISNLGKFTLIGKGNMDSFAFGSTTQNSYFGPSFNPHNINTVAGGSSGGVASAVASGSAIFGIGSDTGGSVRQPASFCGIVGLKPTYGLISRYGLIAMGSSFDTIGIMANTVHDVALVLNEACKYDPKDSTSLNLKKKLDYSKFNDVSKLKVGVLKFSDDGVEKNVMNAFSNSIKDIKKLGCSVKEVTIDHLKYVIAAYYILVPSEISANMARFDGIRFGYHSKGIKDIEEFYLEARSKFEDEVKRRILIGTYTLSSGYYDAYYSKADAVRRLIKQEFDDVFKDIDVIVSPTSPTVAYKKDKVFDNPLELYLSDIFTIPANLIGAPAISIPNGLSCDNLPTGLQIMGPQLSELNILSLANKLYKKYG